MHLVAELRICFDHIWLQSYFMLQRYDFAFSFDRSKQDETDKTAVETDKRSVETDGSIIYTVFDACIMNVDCQNRV